MWLPLLRTRWADRAAASSCIGENKTLGIEMVEWKNLHVQTPIPSSGRKAMSRQFSFESETGHWCICNTPKTAVASSAPRRHSPEWRTEGSLPHSHALFQLENQVPGDQFMLTNVYSFDDHCRQDGMDRNVPNLNPRYNSTEISRIGGQTPRPPSKPPWRDVPLPTASSRDILPKGRPHKSSAQSALFSR